MKGKKEGVQRELYRFTALFAVGGIGYNGLEVLWRGYSHWSMTILGGLCFHMIGRIYLRLFSRTKTGCCALCALAVTAAEFVTGCVVNRLCRMQVWDYSGLSGNLLGQVCIWYTLLWGLLSLPAGWLYARLYRLPVMQAVRRIGGKKRIKRKSAS